MRIPDSEHLLTASVGNVDKKDTTQTRVKRQNKKLSPERELRPGSAWWEALTKKIPI